MTTSVFDLFKVGIGPSSSHTVGPMRAARQFAQELRSDPRLGSDTTLRIELFGSLAATGRGHGTLTAVMLGLEGHHPETIDPDEMPAHLSRIRGTARLRLNGTHAIAFNEEDHIALHALQRLPTHPNGMRFTAVAGHGAELLRRTYFSIGGGTVVDEHAPDAEATERAIPYPFGSARELLEHARRAQLPISGVMLANEQVDRTQRDVRHGLLLIWHTMQSCMHRGCAQEGQLPGGLGVERRAATVRRSLESRPDPQDPLLAMDWVSLWALAVNEENAAGGRVVTAPTNGAAGIVPAVLQYYDHFVPGADDEGVVRFLLTPGAIGTLYKRNASISGAEVGCQGEVGSACSMAAAGLAEVLGGTPGTGRASRGESAWSTTSG